MDSPVWNDWEFISLSPRKNMKRKQSFTKWSPWPWITELFSVTFYCLIHLDSIINIFVNFLHISYDVYSQLLPITSFRLISTFPPYSSCLLSLNWLQFVLFLCFWVQGNHWSMVDITGFTPSTKTEFFPWESIHY